MRLFIGLDGLARDSGPDRCGPKTLRRRLYL